MDQDAFRKLLSTPKNNGTQHQLPTRGSLLPPKAKDDQNKSTSASQPAFKPRKVKKQTGAGYRDRATERRAGAAGDFAEVESVLETFEKQHANEDKKIVEEHRKYLGGDSEHTVLVKGLDFALLEQAKARIAASSSAHDDEELEEAFLGVASGSPPPVEQSSSQKRTREDIIRELKSKRSKSDSNGVVGPGIDKSLDEAKRDGKFKPIGFKPIGSSSSKAKEGKEAMKKKKKRKVEEDKAGQSASRARDEGTKEVGTSITKDVNQHSDSVRVSNRKPEPEREPETEPEPLNEDFDIFADAGDYEGINLGDDDADDDLSGDDSPRIQHDDRPAQSPKDEVSQEEDIPPESRAKRKWIEDDEDKHPPQLDVKGKEKKSPAHAEMDDARHTSPRSAEPEDEADSYPEHKYEPEPIARLAPLASSSIPSIRDILAADSALEAEQKRKSRKEKLKQKRGGDGVDGGSSLGGSGGAGGEKKKVSKEAKLNREYQKLKSYTEKKGGKGL